MWNLIRQNRIVDERQKTKVRYNLVTYQEHELHLRRLNSVKATIDIRKPVKPSFIKTNMKREL